MSTNRLVLVVLCLVIGACGTSPPAVDRPAATWTYTDLQLLDPLDGPAPELELVALYSRVWGSDLQIRIDVLDIGAAAPFDLYMALDLVPGGGGRLPFGAQSGLAFDLLLTFEDGRPPRALDHKLRPMPNLVPRLIREPDLDTLTVSLNRLALPPDLRRARIEVYVVPPDAPAAADSLGPNLLFNDDRPPRAPLNLVFWNAFQARTPAQALRRWDGAHTGPYGERHGLRNLLTAARGHQVPVTLLDLKTTSSLAALDFLGLMPVVQPLVVDGLVSAPDAVPMTHGAGAGFLPFNPQPEALDAGVRLGRQTGIAYGLPASPAIYAPLVPANTSGYRLLILPGATAESLPVSSESEAQTAAEELPAVQNEPVPFLQERNGAPSTGITSLGRWENRLTLELPALHPLPQATDDGLAIEIRRDLLSLALSGQDGGRPGGGQFMILGGDLTTSAWGDPRAARASMRYIAAHPWIQPLSLDQLLNLPAPHAARPPEAVPPLNRVPLDLEGRPIVSGLNADELAGVMWRRISALQDVEMQRLAVEAYFTLLAPNPPEDPQLPALRTGYLGLLGNLLGAAEAVERMEAGEVDCLADPDMDGEAECVLRSAHFVLVIEPAGAQVTHALARTPEGWRQWIAPYAQFLAGFGDPAAWDITAGPAGDPASLLGGFSDGQDRWLLYTPMPLPDGVRFEAIDGSRAKTFEWTGAGELRVTYEGSPDAEITAQVPLALAAGGTGTPGWAAGYRLEHTQGGMSWGRDGAYRLEMQTDQPSTVVAYRDSMGRLKFPEDPNFDYAPGHFLPLQITLLEIRGAGDWEASIRVIPT